MPCLLAQQVRTQLVDVSILQRARIEQAGLRKAQNVLSVPFRVALKLREREIGRIERKELQPLPGGRRKHTGHSVRIA